MAAAAFAGLVSLKNNLDLIQNHPTHSFTFEPKQIQSLKETVTSLIHFLKRSNYSPGIRKEAAEALERQIARAAEAAEDVVESHVVDQIRSGETRRSNRSRRFLLNLQKVSLDLDYMSRKATITTLNAGNIAEAAAAATSSTSYNTTTTTTSTAMVGFDGLLLQLLDKLTGVPSSRQVIPIVGMGGIGKTTLAKNVFQHPTVVEHFHICLWATISQQYSVAKIISQLLSGLKTFKTKTSDEPASYRNADEAPEDELRKGLYGRRYLIVLDDMWSVQAWHDVKFFFPETKNGSRILVTTRLSDVANRFSTSWKAIGVLDEVDSWDLFCRKTFGEEKGCPPELEEIGKKIVEKCNGLPLAIVVVGGHLSHSSMAHEYWVNVANHMYSVLNSAEGEEQCLKVLSLSYSYLPPHLKPCFLLLGAFPEDEEIRGDEIGNIWIAEGLIEPTENKVLETVAKDYLMDLYERNLILVDGLDYNGKIVDFKVHDLLREMCVKIGEKEELLLVLDSEGAISRERRVVISGVQNNQLRTKPSDAPIRCLMYVGDWPSCDLKLLRTLNQVVSESISWSVFQQLNLRFLKVNLEKSSLNIFYLPSSISLLWNLQILTIDLDGSLRKVILAPYEIWEMLQLRHLDIFPVCLVDPLPVERLGERNDDDDNLIMKNLQTVLEVENFRLSEEVCKRIPNITQLQLHYLNGASSYTYYCLHNLCYFLKLEHFRCDFYGYGNWRDFALSLTFPASLKWLFLGGCGVDWEEMTAMVGSLPHLISLRLTSNAVIGSVWTSVEDRFVSLKNLEVWECDELVHLNVESSHFPVLVTLDLRRLPNLEELASEIGEITTLKGVGMEDCSESSSISAIRILVEQEEQGNEDFWVHVSLHGDEEELESFNNQVREVNLTSNNLYLDLEIQ